jgi:LacI family transcriptional regulator
MPATLRDIAAELQLSVGTVSKVLNQSRDASIPDATRQRILQTAERLGYRPHAAARALRSGKTGIVALALRRSTPTHGIAEILAERLSSHGYSLLIQAYPDQEQLLSGLDRLARSHSCDAVLLWGNEADLEEQGRLLEGRDLPFIVKGRHEERHPSWLQVEFDHEAMMGEAVRFLFDRGHRRIAYLGYDADAVFRYRLREGFLQALDRHPLDPACQNLIAEGTSSVEFNRDQMEGWLSLPPERQPTALVIASGNAAWEGVELALARRGRVMGSGTNDLAVAGVSDPGLRLLFGHGFAYQEIEFRRLAQSLSERLLLPLLSGQPVPQPVVRIQPSLQPLPSRELLRSDLFPVSRPSRDERRVFP